MKNIKSNIIPQNGWIVLCKYCGEQIGNSQKFCTLCKTQEGRKKIFDENMAIINEKIKLNLPVPKTLKSWK